jgi:hypothetical protein
MIRLFTPKQNYQQGYFISSGQSYTVGKASPARYPQCGPALRFGVNNLVGLFLLAPPNQTDLPGVEGTQEALTTTVKELTAMANHTIPPTDPNERFTWYERVQAEINAEASPRLQLSKELQDLTAAYNAGTLRMSLAEYQETRRLIMQAAASAPARWEEVL